jgi:hypothetical protein
LEEEDPNTLGIHKIGFEELKGRNPKRKSMQWLLRKELRRKCDLNTPGRIPEKALMKPPRWVKAVSKWRTMMFLGG